MDERELIASLVHAVHTQHEAIDSLMARLIVADSTFRPSQSGEIWEAVLCGRRALRDWMQLEKGRTD